MPSVNSKTGNSQQLLGESYFTRNQAFYFALLAIKNAFSLDEMQNLQKLRKRRNNTTWYFARMGNKVRKILGVVQAVREKFFEKAGAVTMATLLFLAPGFNKEVNAAEAIKEGPKLALNTKAPVLPEGPNGNTAPLFQKASLPEEAVKPPCKDMRKCTRKEAYDLSEGQIMFHYPDNVVGVTILAEVLTEDGFTAVAVPGGTKPGIVEMRVNKSSVIKLTQDDVNSGSAGGRAMDLHNLRIAGKKLPTKDGELHSHLDIK